LRFLHAFEKIKSIDDFDSFCKETGLRRSTVWSYLYGAASHFNGFPPTELLRLVKPHVRDAMLKLYKDRMFDILSGPLLGLHKKIDDAEFGEVRLARLFIMRSSEQTLPQFTSVAVK